MRRAVPSRIEAPSMTRVVAAAGVLIALVAVALTVFISTASFEDEPRAHVLWISGGLYLLLFVVVNFWLERIWIPRPRVGGMPPPPLVGDERRLHIAFGTVEATIFILAILLLGSGTSIMGTRGYGSF
jgi:hypothetical protein